MDYCNQDCGKYGMPKDCFAWCKANICNDDQKWDANQVGRANLDLSIDHRNIYALCTYRIIGHTHARTRTLSPTRLRTPSPSYYS